MLGYVLSAPTGHVDAITNCNEAVSNQESSLSYPIVDTGQRGYYDNYSEIVEPKDGEDFYGQDATYVTNTALYEVNGDGTVSDLVTGLMWQQDAGDKMTYSEAMAYAEKSTFAGYDDWRVPTIKELYSLIDFNGKTGKSLKTTIPYLDSESFVFHYGDEANGERFIDGQYMSSTKYVGLTMNKDETIFGVNFVDGRIKGYPIDDPRTRQENDFYVLLVRGNDLYGENNFVDNGDGTITDFSTGLMWMQEDSGQAMTWEEALLYAEKYDGAGYDDWKLPDAKELQSIVDYSRSLDTSNSAAINPVFETTAILDEGNNKNYPFFWSSTTHLDGKRAGNSAVYVAFGEALGFMSTPRSSEKILMDIHGAGAQRSDPKTGSAEEYPEGHGPQGDVRRVENYVRLVRIAD